MLQSSMRCVCDGQPPPGFGMRIHKSKDASGDVAWSWNRVVKFCQPEGCLNGASTLYTVCQYISKHDDNFGAFSFMT